MDGNVLNIALVQPDIRWKDTVSNRQKYSSMFSRLTTPVDLVLLPEMFTTGFCTNPADVAEDMDGETVQWMKKAAANLHAMIAGSIIITEEGKYFNRLVAVAPDQTIRCYDKRHLFRMAGEEEMYTPGQERLVVELGRWRIAFQICYDLRFPVWARNRNDYDLLVYSANWPDTRNDVWNILLRARAIENQCYVAGVNRIGIDGNNIDYSGESMIIDPKGNTIGSFVPREEAIKVLGISMDDLNDFRLKFPVWKDWDRFSL